MKHKNKTFNVEKQKKRNQEKSGVNLKGKRQQGRS